MRQVPRIFVSYAWWLNCRPLMSQLIFSLQGLVSVSGPPKSKKQFQHAQEAKSFHAQASSYQQGFCSYWLWLHSSLGTITGRSVNTWKDGSWAPWVASRSIYSADDPIFCDFLPFFFLPPKVNDSKIYITLLQMVKEWVLCWGKCPYSKVFSFYPYFSGRLPTWWAYFSIGWIPQQLGKAPINRQWWTPQKFNPLKGNFIFQLANSEASGV